MLKDSMNSLTLPDFHRFAPLRPEAFCLISFYFLQFSPLPATPYYFLLMYSTSCWFLLLPVSFRRCHFSHVILLLHSFIKLWFVSSFLSFHTLFFFLFHLLLPRCAAAGFVLVRLLVHCSDPSSVAQELDLCSHWSNRPEPLEGLQNEWTRLNSWSSGGSLVHCAAVQWIRESLLWKLESLKWLSDSVRQKIKWFPQLFSSSD